MTNPKELLVKAKHKAIYENLDKWLASTRINIGMSTCEIAAGSKTVLETIQKEIIKHKIKNVYIGKKGCIGRCYLEPTVEVYQAGKPPFKYVQVDEKKAKQIVYEHLLSNKPHPKKIEDTYDFLSKDTLTDKSRYIFGDVDYFKQQKRIVLRNCGVVDPESLDDYLAVRGYEALAKVLTEYTSPQVIDEITKSGLRGRGGGGFPTGVKWKFVYDQKADQKYVICNADEGDPGAFMDRSTIEGDPFSVIEAMTIAGFAVGASKGIVYIRAEYPLAVERLRIALAKAKENNFIGENILKTKFSFDIEIVLGAGAFVCGEETALIHSIEGERGMPRIRPPYPPVKGLFGKPTLINNVETWANIPAIILDGYKAFASIGTEKSKGTKVFALAGKVKNTGLVEVPMGYTLGEVIFDIGGGIKNDKKFKAAQTGGPSGGCLPVQFLNTPVDYESLVAAGSIMGSGGLIVMDETDCMVDVARFFLEFTQEESCGKCTPCREGTKRMLEILNRITSGKGKEGDIELLQELGEIIKKTALCGLGQTAPNPVLSTIKYFRDEYEAHIKEKKCPAVVCGELFASPCQHSCPVHIDVPAYIGNIRQGKFLESLKVIMDRNPLPSICGRVCHHPCEANCRRGKFDESVAIMKLKRFASDDADKHNLKLEAFKGERRKEKIAVIGSGPAGLTCAYHLAKKGYKVTVFESSKVPGGMLALGIPEYRLPKKIVAKDIKRIKDTGVEFKTGVTIGKDISLSNLEEQGYSSIFMAIGGWKDRYLSIPGSNMLGVLSSLEFLKDCNTGKIKTLNKKHVLVKNNEAIEITGKKVAIIGGGNAAMDAARTSLRLGASEVNVIYRRTKDAMPAFKEEIEEALKEGVKIHYLLNPSAITGKDSKVEQVQCAVMKLAEFDLSARRKAVPSGEVKTIPADIVIMAIGAQPDMLDIAKTAKIDLNSSGTIKVDPVTLCTSVFGIFAGGDAIEGRASVTDAMGDGERAAVSIDRYLNNQDMKKDRFIIKGERKLVDYIDPSAEVISKPRPKPDMMPVNARVKCFAEVEKGFNRNTALKESDRCLRCDRMDKEVAEAGK
jgi:NADH-quinone oxidoreductase subunit F